MMDTFFPSEVARLILGYLKEVNCMKSWRTFLEESSNLQEYLLLYQKGNVYSTNVYGKSLSDILNEYCVLKRSSDNEKSEFPKEGSILEDMKNVIDLAFQKYLPLICGKKDCLSPSDSTSINDSEFTVKLSNDNVNNLHEEQKDRIQNYNGESSSELNFATKKVSNYDNVYISEVMSLNDTAQNMAESSKNEMSIDCSENNLFADSFKDEKFKDSSETETFEAASKNKCLSLLEVIKEKSDSNLQVNSPVIDVECKNSTDVPDIRITSQSECCHESMNDCIIEEEVHNDCLILTTKNSNVFTKGSSISNLSLSDIQHVDKLVESVEVNNNVELKNANTVETNLSSKVHSGAEIAANNSIQNCVPFLRTQSNDSSFIEISQVTTHNDSNTVGQIDSLGYNLNSSNNQLGFAVTTNSFSNQVATTDELPLHNAPTYFLSSGTFMQDTPSYFVINTPVRGMSLTSEVPVSFSNPVFSTADTENANINFITSGIPVNNISGLVTASKTENKNKVNASVSSSSASDAPTIATNLKSKGIDVKARRGRPRRGINKNEALPSRKCNKCQEVSKRTFNVKGALKKSARKKGKTTISNRLRNSR